MRGKWVLKGEPALVQLEQPEVRREGQLLFGGVFGDRRGGMDGAGGEQQLRNIGSLPGTVAGEAQRSSERDLDNAPAHRGEAVREYLRTPGLNLRLFNLPGYSPDFNADEAVWGWAREEATGNLCLGTKVKVQERVGSFLVGLANRKEEVKRRCRTVLQSRAGTLLLDSHSNSQHPGNAHPTLALV